MGAGVGCATGDTRGRVRSRPSVVMTAGTRSHDMSSSSGTMRLGFSRTLATIGFTVDGSLARVFGAKTASNSGLGDVGLDNVPGRNAYRLATGRNTPRAPSRA